MRTCTIGIGAGVSVGVSRVCVVSGCLNPCSLCDAPYTPLLRAAHTCTAELNWGVLYLTAVIQGGQGVRIYMAFSLQAFSLAYIDNTPRQPWRRRMWHQKEDTVAVVAAAVRFTGGMGCGRQGAAPQWVAGLRSPANARVQFQSQPTQAGVGVCLPHSLTHVLPSQEHCVTP